MKIPHRHHHRKTHHRNDLLTLSDLPGGAAGIVIGVNGGKELFSRLASIGVTPGTSVLIVQNYGNGPVIIKVRDSRIAVGRGEARNVLVDIT